MRGHLTSIGIGLGIAVLGLVLWRTTGAVSTPVISLDKVGVVLLVLGVIEIAISGVALAAPSTRHRNDPL